MDESPKPEEACEECARLGARIRELEAAEPSDTDEKGGEMGAILRLAVGYEQARLVDRHGMDREILAPDGLTPRWFVKAVALLGDEALREIGSSREALDRAVSMLGARREDGG